MNTKYFKLISLAAFSLMLAFTSCVNDLDTIPLDEDVTTSATIYDDPASYEQILAKCYAGLSVTGQEGPAGQGDLGGIDEGFSSYIRGLWNLEELTSDDAVTGWGDAGLSNLHNQNWTASNDFIKGFYYRVFYQITLANEFIRESTDEKLASRGIEGTDKTNIEIYHAEARFLRAFSYWHALDMFGSVPFVTEEDPIGAFFPEQISKTDLFNYIESELLEIEGSLAEPKANVYGRIDKAAAWTLLAKLYLNAEVYTGEDKYTECVTYSKKVIDSGYALDSNYSKLFLTDNYDADGIIFPIVSDGANAKTWGSTTFIINGGIGGGMVAADYGVKEAWGGHRATKALVTKFPAYESLKSASMPRLKSAADYPVIYVPGGYQAASGYSEGDWAPDTAPTLASVNSDGIYEGYIYFAVAADFKFTPNPDWSADYGDNEGDGILDAPNGANISVSEPGYYQMIVNLNDMTYSITKTEWGIIGDATADGWDSDQNMEFDADTKSWSIIANLSAAEVKFRANDGWDINYGDTNADGSLEVGGDNLVITEPGKYKLSLFLGEAPYTYSVEKFSTDERAMFYTDGQEIEISDITKFTDGYAVVKFKNISSTGVGGTDLTHSDTDFPIFRVADAYLMYAEAVLRGGSGGDLTSALNYVNMILTRAYGDEGGNITASELTLNFILDERSREFYWEAQRRTDLVRYGLLTGGDYLWPWKGGIADGTATDAKYDIFPIPASDIVANSNLTQNAGY